MENNTTLTVQGKEQKKNPVSRFFSAVNAKRKKIMLTLTTMVTMSMMSTAMERLPQFSLAAADEIVGVS